MNTVHIWCIQYINSKWLVEYKIIYSVQENLMLDQFIKYSLKNQGYKFHASTDQKDICGVFLFLFVFAILRCNHLYGT